MKPNDNCASGIALFDAFPTISALQAADNRLWIYLAIADLFSYVRAKWAINMPDANDPERIEKMKSNIRIHWFGLQKDSSTFAPMRHALANLWWSVYISVDRKATTLEEKYKYTRLLFQNETFRTRTGILDFMEMCPEIFSKNKESAFNEITKYLNCIGGGIQLSFMKRNFFLEQLLKNKELLIERIGRDVLETPNDIDSNIYQNNIDPTHLKVEEPIYTDYFNVKDTITSMINKTELK